MKKTDQPQDDDMRPEYDFASMKGGVRGKHFARFREGTNIVLLDPEVAEAFPSEAAVNEALRGILNTTRAVRSTGGLPIAFSKSRANRFASRMSEGAVAVVLEPDVAQVFDSAASVNQLLRSVISALPARGRRYRGTRRKAG